MLFFLVEVMLSDFVPVSDTYTWKIQNRLPARKLTDRAAGPENSKQTPNGNNGQEQSRAEQGRWPAHKNRHH